MMPSLAACPSETGVVVPIVAIAARRAPLRRIHLLGTSVGSVGYVGMALIKRLRGVPTRFGGEEHSGWLPANAATPPPAPLEEALLDLEISEVQGGYILQWHSRNTRHHGDLWYETLEDVLERARIAFDIHPDEWQTVEPDK
jgi:hypothetical protein